MRELVPGDKVKFQWAPDGRAQADLPTVTGVIAGKVAIEIDPHDPYRTTYYRVTLDVAGKQTRITMRGNQLEKL